jgi:hypothetical protein
VKKCTPQHSKVHPKKAIAQRTFPPKGVKTSKFFQKRQWMKKVRTGIQKSSRSPVIFHVFRTETKGLFQKQKEGKAIAERSLHTKTHEKTGRGGV